MLSYADSEKDLGVHMNTNFNFTEHCEKNVMQGQSIIWNPKTYVPLCFDSNRRKILYLILVRSQFEHCSPVWRPSGSSMIS